MLARAHRGFVRAQLACATLLACAALLGCERKAPGPQECAQFAAAVVLQHAPIGILTLEMQAQIEEETRNCLTRPYDRELLSCVLVTNRGRACLESFRRRSGRIVTPAVDPG
ncbi:MAG: hypothetical protein ABUL62_13405 [Myxococcales bacterium]|jgi:hypothetical protein